MTQGEFQSFHSLSFDAAHTAVTTDPFRDGSTRYFIVRFISLGLSAPETYLGSGNSVLLREARHGLHHP